MPRRERWDARSIPPHLKLTHDIILSLNRNHRRTEFPEHAVPVAFHVDVAAGTQQGHGICVSSDFRRIAIAGKG